MKELIDALADRHSEYTLTNLTADAMQDSQYSPGARKFAIIFQKYEPQYGRYTVREIREMYASRQ